MVNKTYRKKFTSLLLVGLFLLSLIVTLLGQTPFVHAQSAPPTSGSWIDRTRIKSGDSYYRPAHEFGWSNLYMLDSGWSPHSVANDGNKMIFDQCQPVIEVLNFDSDGTAAIYHAHHKAADGQCVPDTKGTDLRLDNADRRFVTGYRLSGDASNTIFLPIYKNVGTGAGLAGTGFGGGEYTGTDGYYKQRPADSPKHHDDQFEFYKDSKWFWDDGGSKVMSDGSTQAVLHTQHCSRVGGCSGDGNYDITLANAGNPTDPATIDGVYAQVLATAISGNQSDGGNNTHIDCEWSFTNPLTWLMCPLLDLAQAMINSIGGWIQNQLEIPTDIYFDAGGGAGKQIFTAWNNVRLIAMSLLVIVAMIMVITQALGFEILDAYTVKKVLPRILVAVIFINLSWPLARFAIDISNSLGVAVRTIILRPFQDSTGKLVTSSITAGQSSLVAAAALGGAAALGTLGLLTFLATAALALAIAFVSIILREMALIFLVILAPVAIIAYILPGTQKVWKFWWDSFLGALVVYPIITGFIAMGAAFGSIASAISDQKLGGMGGLVALIATFLPFFLIPKAFSMAGGIVGGLGGMVNDRGRGAFDRLKKFRQQQPGKQFSRAKEGNFFKHAKEGSLRSRFNTAGSVVGNANRMGLNPRDWRARMGVAIADQSILNRNKMLEDTDYTWKGDDDLNRAAAESRDSNELQRILSTGANRARYTDINGRFDSARMQRDVARVEGMRAKYGNASFRQAAWLQAVKGGTAYTGVDDAWQAAASISGGDNAVLSDLVAKGRDAAMSAGRVDQGGAGFGDTLRTAQSYANGSGGRLIDENGNQSDAGTFLARRVLEAQGAGVLTHQSMKTQAIKNLAPQMVTSLNDAISSGNERAVAQQLASIGGVLDSMGQSNPEKARLLADTVMDHGIIAYGGHDTVSDLLEAYRGDANFQQMRREYQTRADQQAATYSARARGSGPGGPPTATGGPPISSS